MMWGGENVLVLPFSSAIIKGLTVTNYQLLYKIDCEDRQTGAVLVIWSEKVNSGGVFIAKTEQALLDSVVG